jgi:hypothetical protein
MEKRIFTNGFATVKTANTMQPIDPNNKNTFRKLWIYPAKGQAAGLLTANVGTVYVGKRGSGELVTPDALAVNDGPLVYELSPGQELQVQDVIFQGANVGDGVFFCYT